AELSLLAIGLGCHIQSLPAGAPVDIKSLTARFAEGPTRIAAARRELEAHGYLRRERHRTATGRIVTRTISCNQPGTRRQPADTGCPDPQPRPPAKRPPQPPRPRKALPAVPRPAFPAATLLRQATDLLTGLRRHDPRLLLSAADTEHLAPGVATWLEREATPAAVRLALTADLPDEPLTRPAALLAPRLTAAPPAAPPCRPPASPPPAPRPSLAAGTAARPRQHSARALRRPRLNPPHEAMQRIVQHDAGLVSRVSRFLGVEIPRPVRATAHPTDLTEASPVERRVDTL